MKKKILVTKKNLWQREKVCCSCAGDNSRIWNRDGRGQRCSRSRRRRKVRQLRQVSRFRRLPIYFTGSQSLIQLSHNWHSFMFLPQYLVPRSMSLPPMQNPRQSKESETPEKAPQKSFKTPIMIQRNYPILFQARNARERATAVLRIVMEWPKIQMMTLMEPNSQRRKRSRFYMTK